MTDAEFNQRFLDALEQLSKESFEIVVSHEYRPTTGPRMSSLGSCARKSWYSASGTPETNPQPAERNWSTMLGNHIQGMAAAVLERMGYIVEGQEQTVELADGLIVGHVDGRLSGLDLDTSWAVWDSKGRGLWGLVGTKKSMGLIANEIVQADMDIYMQMQAYMAALDKELTIVTVHPYDLSGLRVQAIQKHLPVQPAYRKIVYADEEAQKLALTRGKILAAAIKGGLMPQREFDPTRDEFPCNYCPWRSQCLLDELSIKIEVYLPTIPAEWAWTKV